jgi:hypothetical protein
MNSYITSRDNNSIFISNKRVAYLSIMIFDGDREKSTYKLDEPNHKNNSIEINSNFKYFENIGYMLDYEYMKNRL